MILNEKELIVGIPAMKIKKLLQSIEGISNDFLTIEHVREQLNLTAYKAEKLMKGLEELDYVVYLEKVRGWTNTIKGDIFANLELHRFISRSTADEFIKDIVARIKEVNEDKESLFTVTHANVFGEYMDDTINEFSCLLVAVCLYQKHNSEVHKELRAKQLAKDRENHLAYLNMLFRPETKICQFIKDRRHNVFVEPVKEIKPYTEIKSKPIFPES
jgi:hypothetical protein